MRDIIKEALEQQAEDGREVERRRKNVIVYRVPESQTGNREAMEKDDRSFIKDLMEGPLEIPHLSGTVKSIISLGKKIEGSDGRPMLVQLAKVEDKEQFMQCLKNLKTAEDKFKKISVAHDLTPKQRESVKRMLTEAKKEQEEKEKSAGSSQTGSWSFRVVDQMTTPRVIRVKVG